MLLFIGEPFLSSSAQVSLFRRVPLTSIVLITTFKTRPTQLPNSFLLFGLISVGAFRPSSPWGQRGPPGLVHHKQPTTKPSCFCFLSISQACPLLSFSVAAYLVQATFTSASGWLLGLWSGSCTPFATQQLECPFIAHNTPSRWVVFPTASGFHCCYREVSCRSYQGFLDCESGFSSLTARRDGPSLPLLFCSFTMMGSFCLSFWGLFG